MAVTTKAEAYYQALNTFGNSLQQMAAAVKELTDFLKNEVETDQVKPTTPVVDEHPVENPFPTAPVEIKAEVNWAKPDVRMLIVAGKNKGLQPNKFIQEFCTKHSITPQKFEAIPETMMNDLVAALKEGGYA